MQNVLHLHSTDVRDILHALAEKRDEAPQFFLRSPLAVDCLAVQEESAEIDFKKLMQELRALSFVPIGVRHLSEKAVEQATEAGWAILRDSTARKVDILPSQSENNEEQDNKPAEEPEGKEVTTATGDRVMVINRPIRSGQQVYSPDGDIVVLSQTGAGSEVLAGGSVHVYGKVAGRVLAGVNGDRSARIFCQGLDAELIAIAGNYQLLDEVDTPLKGKPAMISLEGDKLKIEPMV